MEHPAVERAVHNFFDQLAFMLAYAKDAQKQLDTHLASGLNIIRDYVQLDESRLSDIIADLLNPEGKHGQDRVFLKKFLQLVELEKYDSEQVVVSREVFTHDERRIDILVEFDGRRVIAIENKPFAGDQPKQIVAYSEFLAKGYPDNYVLFYLTPAGGHPSLNSIDAGRRDVLLTQGRLKEISYKLEILNWVELCRKECRAEKVRWVLGDFASFIRDEFQDESTESTEVSDHAK